MPNTFPLQDVRVLSIEQFGAGPWATMQLADLGAEVIKIEDPTVGGDVGRYVPPYQEGEDSLFFESFNRGKKSISLDLRKTGGRRAFEDLVGHSDVVFSNLRGDQPGRLALLYDDLRHVNERIVCCSLSGFGTTGPRAAEGGYDYVVQGLAGWMSLTGEPDAPPTKTGLSLVDLSAGYVAALAIVAGVWQARRDGRGCDCDISLFETALAQLAYVGTWVASREFEPTRLPQSAHPSIVPFQVFRTADGWITVAAAKQSLWERLCHAIEQPALLDDPRYGSFADRQANRAELVASLEATFRRRDTEAWVAALSAAGVPAGPVNDVDGALADHQSVAREVMAEYSHPALGPVRQPASPLRLGSPTPIRRAPFRGEHTSAVLRELCGYGDERLAQLGAEGVFG